MIKRILHNACFLNFLWAITVIGCLGCLIYLIYSIFYSYEEAQSVDATDNQSCGIPIDYCKPSIKSLEQELKIAFRINDEYIELAGKEKAELINTLKMCKRKKKEISDIYGECTELFYINENKLVQCFRILNGCNRELRKCVTPK